MGFCLAMGLPKRRGEEQQEESAGGGELDFGHEEKFGGGCEQAGAQRGAGESGGGDGCDESGREGGAAVGREREGEDGRGGGEAAAVEERAEFFEGALDAHAGGVFGEGEAAADFGEAVVFEKAEQEGVAVGGFERVEAFVEERFQAGPVGSG